MMRIYLLHLAALDAHETTTRSNLSLNDDEAIDEFYDIKAPRELLPKRNRGINSDSDATAGLFKV